MTSPVWMSFLKKDKHLILLHPYGKTSKPPPIVTTDGNSFERSPDYSADMDILHEHMQPMTVYQAAVMTLAAVGKLHL